MNNAIQCSKKNISQLRTGGEDEKNNRVQQQEWKWIWKSHFKRFYYVYSHRSQRCRYCERTSIAHFWADLPTVEPTNALKEREKEKKCKNWKTFCTSLCNSINFTFYKSQNLLNPDYYVIIFNDLFFFCLSVFFFGAHCFYIDWFVFIQLDYEIYRSRCASHECANVYNMKSQSSDVVFFGYSILLFFFVLRHLRRAKWR